MLASAAEAPRATLAALLAGAAADPAAALQRAADRARDRAFVVLPLGLQPATDARELASLHAAIALQSVRHGRPMAPTVILSAGPVLHAGAAAGAADFLLALALALDENPLIHAGACHAGTPAPGGGAPQTGFCIGPATVRRSLAAGLQPGALLAGGKAPALFAALGDTFAATAGTGCVLRAILIGLE
jgi:hydroxypyruvate reductase